MCQSPRPELLPLSGLPLLCRPLRRPLERPPFGGPASGPTNIFSRVAGLAPACMPAAPISAPEPPGNVEKAALHAGPPTALQEFLPRLRSAVLGIGLVGGTEA